VYNQNKETIKETMVVLGKEDEKGGNVVGVRGEGKVVFNRDIFQCIYFVFPWD